MSECKIQFTYPYKLEYAHTRKKLIVSFDCHKILKRCGWHTITLKNRSVDHGDRPVELSLRGDCWVSRWLVNRDNETCETSKF